MDLLLNSPISWIVFVGIVLFLIFSMSKIKQEKTEFLDDAKFIQLGEFSIPIANWWTQVFSETNDNNELIFKRIDTHYDWYARFSFYQSEKNLQTILDEIIQEQNIQFDPEVIIESDPAYIFLDKKIPDMIEQLIKVEGCASKDEIERIYLDLLLFKTTQGQTYIFESTASVLNGGVEGPYFEEAIKNIKMN